MRRGIALIEFLAVIAILSVLACIVLPALRTPVSWPAGRAAPDNLKRMGLAASQLHCHARGLADERGRGGRAWLGHTCFVQILPYSNFLQFIIRTFLA